MVGDEEIPRVLGDGEALLVRDPLDRYPTPLSIVRLMVIEFLACIFPEQDVWEPCVGDGGYAGQKLNNY